MWTGPDPRSRPARWIRPRSRCSTPRRRPGARACSRPTPAVAARSGPSCARVIGARVIGARVVGARVIGARVVGARLVGTRLVGARLAFHGGQPEVADLRGAAPVDHMGKDPNWRSKPSILDQLRGWPAPTRAKRLSSRAKAEPITHAQRACSGGVAFASSRHRPRSGSVVSSSYTPRRPTPCSRGLLCACGRPLPPLPARAPALLDSDERHRAPPTDMRSRVSVVGAVRPTGEESAPID
jgi:hypothetical protein